MNKLEHNWRVFRIQFYTALIGWFLQLITSIIIQFEYTEATFIIGFSITAIYNIGFYLLVAYFTIMYFQLILRVLDIFQIKKSRPVLSSLATVLAIVMSFIGIYVFSMIYVLIRVYTQNECAVWFPML